MKKTITAICLILVFVLLVGCAPSHACKDVCSVCGGCKTDCAEKECEQKCTCIQEEPLPEKHLITDAQGNFGGTLDETLYGKGAPENGEFDVRNSEYWRVNDYYNMTSTSERTVVPHFQPYQQTMKDSSGLACALMIMNHDGLDVQNTYTEKALVEKYEQLNETTVYGKGTTSDGLKKLFKDYGYVARNAAFTEKGESQAEYILNFNNWLKDNLDNGFFVLVRWEDGVDNGWRIIIGIDTMGVATGDITDDGVWPRSAVLIMANPNDCADHYQDGYTTQASGRFYRWWFDVRHDGSRVDNFDYLLVAPKENAIRYNRVEETRKPVQVRPENHLIRNADGSYGGTSDESIWGSGTPLNGWIDQPTSRYHMFVDYYNMQSNDTRLVLTGYRAFEQTMASSCGICSTFSVLAYYGKDISKWNEVYLVNEYERINNKVIFNSGVGGSGLKKLVTTGLGFPSSDYKSYASANYKDDNSMIFPTYEKFTTWVKGNLSKGTPMPISWRPHGGHWEVIFGYDDMGTDFPYDDVIFLADSGDSWDHYQDGYNTIPATMFYNQWYNGSFTYNQQYNVFDNAANVDAK
ncbi:MAG: C39 family peptidase [Corallococcus sp.]|nr:C39 family peptidase [Corallococcus sp.]